MSDALRERVEAALAEVVDPCSCFTPTPVSIVDLGLVERIEITDEAITVDLCMTDPMCMYFVDIAGEIERRVADLGWSGSVAVNWDTTADWSRDRIRPEARRARMAALQRMHPVTPHAATEAGDR